jgi:hypothetical protein
MVTSIEVNGCAACGRRKYDHGSSWDREVGFHYWIQPRNETLLARMQARRQLRLGS